MNILKHLDTLPEAQREEFSVSYREQVLRALGIAQTYDGSETKYQELTSTLIALESWLKETLGITSGRRISHGDERRLSLELFEGKQRITIDDMIGLSVKRLSLILQGASADSLESLLDALNIPSVALPGVILPPGEQKIPEGSGEGDSRAFEVKFQQRFSQFVALLRRQGIFTDDIVVCHGEISENMMRQVSYYIVEIPRLNKQILLCDQVGEATFVIQGKLPRSVLISLTKERLQEKYPELVTRVVYTSSDIWEAQLSALLFTDGIGAKVDVRDQEALRAEIMKVVPTAAEWGGMRLDVRKKIKINGMGMHAIASKFGFDTRAKDCFNLNPHCQTGDLIYQEDTWEAYKKAVLQAIMIVIPTAAEWANMDENERKRFEIAGMKFHALARLFGFEFEGDLIENPTLHSNFGKLIYDEDPRAAFKEKIRKEVLLIIPTAGEWGGMSADEKRNFKVCDMGLFALSGLFGQKGNPETNKELHHKLGQIIYNEDPRVAFRELIRREIIARFPTLSEWMSILRVIDRQNIEFRGMKLEKIKTLFDIQSDSGDIFKTDKYSELGRKIYLDNAISRE